MKEAIKNYLALNGVTLILLTIIASTYQGSLLCLSTIYEVFGVNLVIMIGFKLLEHFECNYYLLEVGMKVSFMLGLLMGAGVLFHWYDSLPIGILIGMGIAVYILASLVGIWYIQKDIEWINEKLKNDKNRG